MFQKCGEVGHYYVRLTTAPTLINTEFPYMAWTIKANMTVDPCPLTLESESLTLQEDLLLQHGDNRRTTSQTPAPQKSLCDDHDDVLFGKGWSNPACELQARHRIKNVDGELRPVISALDSEHRVTNGEIHFLRQALKANTGLRDGASTSSGTHPVSCVPLAGRPCPGSPGKTCGLHPTSSQRTSEMITNMTRTRVDSYIRHQQAPSPDEPAEQSQLSQLSASSQLPWSAVGSWRPTNLNWREACLPSPVELAPLGQSQPSPPTLERFVSQTDSMHEAWGSRVGLSPAACGWSPSNHELPPLPPGTRPLRHQVAGHVYGKSSSKLGTRLYLFIELNI